MQKKETVVKVENHGEIILVTDQGRWIRCPVKDIRITGRSAQGVIIFRVDKDEKVVAASYVEREEGIVEEESEESMEG